MVAPHYRINIRCAQVIPSPAVELLSKTFGGRLSLRRSKSESQRDLVAWGLHDRSAAPAIELLLPYLQVKWAEGLFLLELRASKARGKKGLTEWVHKNRWQRPIRMRKRCYTAEQVAEFERIRLAVQALHSGAPHPPG